MDKFDLETITSYWLSYAMIIACDNSTAQEIRLDS